MLFLVIAILSVLAWPEQGIADNNIPKCHGKTKGPDNDSLWNWDEGGTDIPCDEHIYTITGSVTSTDSLSRQVSAASGSVSGFMYGGYGSVSGYSRGEVIDGKGYLVLVVSASDSEYAPTGGTIIIKTTDTKASFVPEGYVATFKCRLEYEAIAALVNNEEFSDDTRAAADTREFDYCRLVTPVLIAP